MEENENKKIATYHTKKKGEKNGRGKKENCITKCS